MAMTFHLDIVSAESEIFSGTVEMVYAPAAMGEVGITPRHTPLLTHLKPGEIRAQLPGGTEESFYVSGGILEIQPHVVTVLSDTAGRAADLDEAAAMESKQAAEQAMSDRRSDMDYARAKIELAQAAAQLQAIQRIRSKTR